MDFNLSYISDVPKIYTLTHDMYQCIRYSIQALNVLRKFQGEQLFMDRFFGSYYMLQETRRWNLVISQLPNQLGWVFEGSKYLGSIF